jgi:hypothetical protein
MLTVPIEPEMPRWIFASLSAHFQSGLDAATLPLFIEGQHRATRDLPNFAELRVDGPWMTELSRGYWRLFSEVNILVQVAKDDRFYHQIHDSVGIVANAFENTIGVFRYGDGPSDDQTEVGCLKLQSQGNERIQINHFGQIAPESNLLQATVEGHYVMNLCR